MSGEGYNEPVSVAVSGNTTIFQKGVPAGSNLLILEIANANLYNLDGFTITGNLNDYGSSITLASVSADYTGGKWPILHASTDLTTLTKNTSGLLVLDVTGLAEIVITASANTGATTVTVINNWRSGTWPVSSTGQASILAAVGAKRQVHVETVAVGVTTGGDAAACAVDQACQYAIVEAPTAYDTEGVNTAEIKVSAVASGTPTSAATVTAGRSLQPSNYEGIVVQCSNTNQLRFASAAASTVAKVFAVATI